MYKNIVEIISIRNKVAHGKSLSSLELDKISDISFGSLITSVYEEYSNYLINRLINLSNGESHLLPMSEKRRRFHHEERRKLRYSFQIEGCRSI